MQYKVIPFVATVQNSQGSEAAASQLQILIEQMSGKGWEYVRLESIETFVAGSNGCFGIGASPGGMTSFSMAVFKQP